MFRSPGNKGSGLREDLQNEKACAGRSFIASLTAPFLILTEVTMWTSLSCCTL